MSIQHAILGLLSERPLTGYDVKKRMVESPLLPWSGNNNQIYKALVELSAKGYVDCEIRHQENSPSKKIYSITAEGMAELNRWIVSDVEPPEFRNRFLLQLAWSHRIDPAELRLLIDRYEGEVEARLQWCEETFRRAAAATKEGGRAAAMRRLIEENVEDFYRNELVWIGKLRREWKRIEEEEDEGMPIRLIEKDGTKFVALDASASPLREEKDAMDVIAACWEHGVSRVLLPADALSDDFFRLRTGLAGQVLQKLTNYRIKTAIVVTDERAVQGKAKEMLAELNKGSEFRAFADADAAERWLIG